MTRLLAALPALLCSAYLTACANNMPAPPSSQGSPGASAAAGQSGFRAGIYRLSSGDKLMITVFQEPDLSGEFTVESGGQINFPLLGRIAVTGLTTSEVEKRLERGLAAGYLVSPDVRANIVAYQPVFVGGEVRKAGEYAFRPGLTAQQAVTLAGGITRYAAEKYYIQRSGAGPDERFRAVADTPVYPGDIITVEERLF